METLKNLILSNLDSIDDLIDNEDLIRLGAMPPQHVPQPARPKKTFPPMDQYSDPRNLPRPRKPWQVPTTPYRAPEFKTPKSLTPKPATPKKKNAPKKNKQAPPQEPKQNPQPTDLVPYSYNFDPKSQKWSPSQEYQLPTPITPTSGFSFFSTITPASGTDFQTSLNGNLHISKVTAYAPAGTKQISGPDIRDATWKFQSLQKINSNEMWEDIIRVLQATPVGQNYQQNFPQLLTKENLAFDLIPDSVRIVPGERLQDGGEIPLIYTATITVHPKVQQQGSGEQKQFEQQVAEPQGAEQQQQKQQQTIPQSQSGQPQQQYHASSEDSMQINSNTVKLAEEQHKELESILEKVASENKISNVQSIRIALDRNEGIVTFKVAEGENIEESDDPGLEMKDKNAGPDGEGDGGGE